MKLICYHATENIFELFLSMCYLAVIIVNCIFIHILFFFFKLGYTHVSKVVDFAEVLEAPRFKAPTMWLSNIWNQPEAT